jgi:kojibiose phosphorylase
MQNAMSDDGWLVHEQDFSFENANFYETIFTVGNGYQGTRGSLEEGHKGELSATYLAGVYDHHDSTVIDLVNAPTWLPVTVRVAGQRLDVQNCKVVEHVRTLDMQTGVLHRTTVFEDKNGHVTKISAARFCSFDNQHLACIKIEITAENHDREIVIEGAVDGERYNLDCLPAYKEKPVLHPEIKWEKWAKSRHLKITETHAEADAVYLEAVTLDTDIAIGTASTLTSVNSDFQADPAGSYEQVAQKLTFQPKRGQVYRFEKFACIYTSRDVARGDIKDQCLAGLKNASKIGFDKCLENNARVWRQKWDSCDCMILGDIEATRAVRFNIYHMLITANENDPRANIGAKSMSGEGYKGHVFWDTEIFLLPFYIFTQPDTARALLLYRYNTLSGALENAKSNGFSGAQFPWESADTGLETTPKWTHDGLNRIWTGEEEIHITSCVAYGALTYTSITGDWEFMRDYGAELLYQTSRFWASRLEFNEDDNQYELTRVIGPDEFHEHIDNNTFTNRMAQWHLAQTAEIFNKMAKDYPDQHEDLLSKLSLTADEVQSWIDIADKIYIPLDQERNLIEQFSGYFDLEDLEISQWDENGMPCYPEGHDHFTLNDTMILKQPDVIMLTYLLPDEFSDAAKAANFEFYEKRTMHKSSLSPAVHCIMGIEVGDYSSALRYFERSAYVDLINNQGNTQDGMHIASAGGTWQSIVCGFGGLRVKNSQMTFKPWLPPSWDGMQFKVLWRGDQVSVELTNIKMQFLLSDDAAEPLAIEVQGEMIVLEPGRKYDVELVDVNHHA